MNGQEKRESAFPVLSLQRRPYAENDVVIYNRGKRGFIEMSSLVKLRLEIVTAKGHVGAVPQMQKK